ncbi:DUF3570 domain-containing protein [Moritella viscosa]|uniref:DUF3570 domain-containing protein n=1 Tax=Moritella viscosa TaxID=80854 RepID=UPI0009100806|nr:DUF3570 domain-containing protein [Moritella viscosa]SGZ08341.1 Putative uncharacterized protein [Moritella viscosa]
MNKKLTLTLLGTVAVTGIGSMTPGAAHAADHISVHHMSYEEFDDKVKAGDNILSLEKSIGLNWTITAELGYDTVSGASPSWKKTTPVASDQDQINRAYSTATAQSLTDQVIRSGKDPYRDGYKVQKSNLEDTRYSASANVTYRDRKRNEWTLGGNYSQEEDYKSMGINSQVLIYADSRKNRSYSIGSSVLFDKTLAFQKYENFENAQEWENIFNSNFEVGLSQVFTPNFYTTFTLYTGYKSGYLSNHYLTVLREINTSGNDNIEDDEVFLGQDSRPNTRLSGGVNIQGFYNINSWIVVRPRYKYFMDDWNVSSHQLGGKLNIKLTDSLTLAPGYSWYTQQGANFYKDPNASDPSFAATGYATSDLRLGDFNANAYELGISMKVFDSWRVNALAAYYKQSNGYESTWWVLGATYEF